MNIFLLGDDAIHQQIAQKKYQTAFWDQFPDSEVQHFDFGENDKHIVEKFLIESQVGFFSTPSLFIIDSLSKLDTKDQELILEVIQNLSPEKWCIVRERKNFPKTDAFVKALTKKGFTIEVFTKKSRNRNDLVKEVSGEFKLPISVIQEISERVTDDEEFLTRLHTVDIFSNGEPIAPEALHKLVPTPVEAKIFDALDMLAAGKQNEALIIFRILLEEDDIFRILGMCAWQLRQMLIVDDYMRSGITDKSSIAKESGLHPFVVQKIQRAIPHFPKKRLAKALRLVAHLDRGLKKSEYTKVSAIDTFVFGI